MGTWRSARSTSFGAGRERFHWNGSEIVVCSVGATTWSALDQARVAFSFEGSEVEVLGTASADQVVGVAPEYREAAVRALGADAGHAESDQLGDRIEMHRLFITPRRELRAGNGGIRAKDLAGGQVGGT